MGLRVIRSDQIIVFVHSCGALLGTPPLASHPLTLPLVHWKCLSTVIKMKWLRLGVLAHHHLHSLGAVGVMGLFTTQWTDDVEQDVLFPGPGPCLNLCY